MNNWLEKCTFKCFSKRRKAIIEHRSSKVMRFTKKFAIISLCCLTLLLVLRLWDQKKLNENHFSYPSVLWWTHLIDSYHQTKQCGVYRCTFTVDRNVLQDENTKAVLFYGSEVSISDLPLPRQPRHIWALLHEESPKNVPFLQYNDVLQHFNLTSTFSRHSNLPLTTHFVKNLDILTSQKYLVPIGQKNKFRKEEKLAPVVFLQSICDTMSGRDEYVEELMQHIEVDSYGQCLHNKDLPESLSKNYLRTIDSPELYKFLARYKFVLAYENGVCNDYITEKFWRPLIIGSIPVYYGSPTIRNWLPNKNSAILIDEFESPKQLATFLKHLDHNDHEYNKYLDHKYSVIEPITNEFLIKSFGQRDEYGENLFEAFECFVCKQMHKSTPMNANQNHYDCGEGLRFPKMSTGTASHDWESIISHGKCRANTLNYFLNKNRNFTSKEFETELVKRIENGVCKV